MERVRERQRSLAENRRALDFLVVSHPILRTSVPGIWAERYILPSLWQMPLENTTLLPSSSLPNGLK